MGALGASSCCVLPLVFFGLGVSGAWIGNLTALAPYQPLFVATAFGFLGAGFWRVYRRPACDGPACPRPAPNRLVTASLWGAAVLVAVAVTFPYVAPLLLS
ncbi:mercuric transporter MerT family protein [Azospirillum brasilense]|uniref:mercuric transporter MerT family protein n=1 Tax=Azospirillum brasilense TaxID=192 RepID=UPI0024941856|nr:mercuric transporter MerT family protein [Azospirillum brasilense]